tara:strand:+ start:924 stop:1571 length:648 start_codon:yes stop_codon:yes gene_type:complete
MNATNNKDIEYIVIIDDDDEETKQSLDTAKIIFKSLYDVQIKVMIVERVGYANLHLYHNLAAIHFTGDCLCVRNDDAFCETYGWDEKLRKSIEPYKDEPIMIHQKGTNETVWWATAPGINRKWYEVSTNNGEIGAFSDVGIDVWLCRIADMTGLKIVPAGYDMLHLQRGDEHRSKHNSNDKLPDDEVLEGKRQGGRNGDEAHRNQLIANLKNWKK